MHRWQNPDVTEDLTLEPVTVADVLGEPWLAETIELEADFEGDVVATLVSHPVETTTDRAVLHVHGFSDYFFHTEWAAWWLERDHQPYGLDLRKYGRSIRPHQSATYVADLAEYYEELDAAWERITVRDGHRHVILSAHSTGGLIVSLWAHDRKPEHLAGLLLNSPWLDLMGPPALRSPVANFALEQLGKVQPMREFVREVRGFYVQGLHKDLGGEWEFNLEWKPEASFPVRLGWLRAIRRGHYRVHAGLDVQAPVLVLSSDRSGNPRKMGDDVFSTDIVLDVRQIRRWSSSIGRHVTYVQVPGAIHDVVLSRTQPRERAYAEIEKWRSTYVD